MWFKWLLILIFIVGCATSKPMHDQQEGSRIYKIEPKNEHNVYNFIDFNALKMVMEATEEQWQRIKEFLGMSSDAKVHQTGGFFDIDLDAAVTRKKEEQTTSEAESQINPNVSGLPK